MEGRDEDKGNVENIPPELQIKHPLEHKWTLWFYEPEKNKEWTQCMHEVYTFDTVEDFWCLYNTIKPTGDLPNLSDYYMFKTGIGPMWEDKQNRNGGKWLFQSDVRFNTMIEKLWLNTLLYMIGELFGNYNDEITGAVMNTRNRGDKINLWTRNYQKKEELLEIGRIFKSKCLNVPNDYKITYEAHSDSQLKSGSRAKCLYQA